MPGTVTVVEQVTATLVMVVPVTVPVSLETVQFSSGPLGEVDTVTA
jgi:hypothetical protein